MPRMLQLAIFITVVLAVIGGSHYYLWARLVRDPGINPPWRWVATWGLILLAVSVPASILLSRVLALPVAKVVLWLPYVWMGALLYLVSFLAVADLARLFVWLVPKLARGTYPLADAGRRLLVSRILAGSALGVSAILVAIAIWGAMRAPEVKRIRIELPNLPAALDGTTIVQISDLHLGPTLQREWLEDVVRRTNELKPDLVAITGDLVDGSVDQLRDVVAPLRGLQARYGVFFVTGNHEYYSGVAAWLEEVERLGIRVLHNRSVPIGGPEASFDLAGIDDAGATGMAPGHGPDLGAALAGRDPSRALVLLAHQPRGVDEAAAAGVGLQLSGHTHGGQLWPWLYMVRLAFPYASGLHLHEGKTWVYVTDGTGFWGPPLRLGTTPEITLITLAAPHPIALSSDPGTGKEGDDDESATTANLERK